MNKLILGVSLLLIWSACSSQKLQMNYQVDVVQNTDTFYVALQPKGKLTSSNAVFQFAATAPGTYQTMNIGRFVSDFEVFDKKGKSIETTRLSENQYQISAPEKVHRITYKVAETFDTQVNEYPVYLMCGTSIEQDHVLFNAHDVLGYFTGYQDSPISIQFTRNPSWMVGTALAEEDGQFVAEDFDRAVDSPILMGTLTKADTTIANTPISIYTYSQNGVYSSQMLLLNMADMLDAARQFLVTLPVDRYTFLYHFEKDIKGQTGAWEHSYSSEYVMGEKEPTPNYMASITDIASHEFFHIVTPLNIHSEVIESFNFVSPTPSLHLWLYEGVTEWASNMLLYRGGVISLEDYLVTGITQKLYIADKYYDASWSLKRLADESFTTVGAKQYGNIYMKGSLVAGLLDIRLLELSGGKYGLRELMLDLVKKYGKGKPISEASFFDEIVALTYPEIRPLLEEFILGTSPLPYEEYLQKLGLKLEKSEKGLDKITRIENPTETQTQLFGAWSRNL